jgi:hypothetical protein
MTGRTASRLAGSSPALRLRKPQKKKKKEKLPAGRGEGGVAGLRLRVRFVPAALLAMPRTALLSSAFLKLGIWQAM